MNTKAFLHTGLARGITPEPSTVLFLPAAAAAERYLRRRRPDGRTDRRFFGRLDADEARKRGEGGGGEDLLTFVRPSVRSSKIALFCGSFSLLSPLQLLRPLLPSLIAPVIRSRIPERASERGTFWPLSSALSD